MDILSASKQQVQDIAESLETHLQEGLSGAQVQERLAHYGPNIIQHGHPKWWQLFVRQVQNPFTYLLFGAAVLSLVLGEVLNAGMISLFLLINIALGFYQEYFAEQTSALLGAYLQSFVNVIRDGAGVRIATDQLVPGDLILLEFGDVVPADIRLVEATNLLLDESTLTGESEPRPKRSEIMIHDSTSPAEADNLLFASSKIVGGHCRSIVLATGMSTVIGGIARTTMATNRESAFAREIRSFTRLMMILVLVSIALAFFVHVLFKPGTIDINILLLFSISLAVAIIPEALPVVITFARSMGARHLAHEQVIVKRLSAIEELGGTQVLCTDKTGTLTENMLSVTGVFGADDRATILINTRRAGATRTQQPSIFDSAIDSALVDTASKEKIPDDGVFSGYTIRDSLPFDPYKRLSAQLLERDGVCAVYIRGAGNEVLRMCTLSDDERTAAESWLAGQEQEGNRVLAIAQLRIESASCNSIPSQFANLVLKGLVAFADPLKKSTHLAIDRARALHIKIKMLTGDSITVAAHIARAAGLRVSEHEMIEGSTLSALSDEDREAAIQRCIIFGRIDPDQKFEIIRILQKSKSVAFLGEGVNDAPALKEAQVGIAVHNATSIARDAADVIILANDLNILVHGIEEGRRVFVNTLKYIKVTIASNLSNLYTMIVAMLLFDYLPMLPLQLLLVNILSDLPLIAIATDHTDIDELRRPQEYKVTQIMLHTFVFAIACTFCDFVFLWHMYHIPARQLQTLWFIYSILGEFVFFFSLRTHKFVLRECLPSKPILLLFGLVSLFTCLLPYTALGKSIFDFAPPTLAHFGWISIILLLTIALLEIMKQIMKHWVNTSF